MEAATATTMVVKIATAEAAPTATHIAPTTADLLSLIFSNKKLTKLNKQ